MHKLMMWIVTLTLVVMVTGIKGQFDPLLNVESCTKDKLRVSTYGATSYGLIYLQGKGDNCRRTTQEGLAVYEFDFNECDIEWEMLFKIIIQKNAGFQTGADKQIPIFCIPDKSDIVVNNENNAGDADDGAGLNKTVKPSAFMTFYKVVSDEEVSGQEVKLTDILIMALQLDSQWTDDFDIKARYCVASGIVIIEDSHYNVTTTVHYNKMMCRTYVPHISPQGQGHSLSCAPDPDLFPNFSKLRTGYLISQFGAFRPTTLEGGAIEMNFTCILEVCKDACEASTCGSKLGWGRRRREVTLDASHVADIVISSPGFSESKNIAKMREVNRDAVHVVDTVIKSHDVPESKTIEKRAAESYDIDVGANVKIVEKYSEIQIVSSETLCMNAALFIALIIFLSVGCLTFACLSGILYRKLSKHQSSSKKLTNQRSLSKESIIHRNNPAVPPVQRFDNPFEPRVTGY